MSEQNGTSGATVPVSDDEAVKKAQIRTLLLEAKESAERQRSLKQERKLRLSKKLFPQRRAPNVMRKSLPLIKEGSREDWSPTNSPGKDTITTAVSSPDNSRGDDTPESTEGKNKIKSSNSLEDSSPSSAELYASFKNMTVEEGWNDPSQIVEPNVEQDVSTLGTMDTPRKGLFVDLAANYAKFKEFKKRSAKSKAKARETGATDTQFTGCMTVMDDVQFCGLYFCGVDLLCETDSGDNTVNYDDLRQQRREKRKEEAEEKFLGKVIKIGADYGCGTGCSL